MSTNESYEEPNATSNTAKSLIGAANYEKKHSSGRSTCLCLFAVKLLKIILLYFLKIRAEKAEVTVSFNL